jgi:putative ABC transport system permease protein
MRLYRALLHLYPASFRNEYGHEMAALFARRRRDASWPLGVLALWLGLLWETAANAAAVHADILRQDLRQTARALGRSPGFALTAVLVVALGVGANTAAFSLADKVLVRPLPFPDSQRLVKLWETLPGYSRMELSPADFRDWAEMSHSLESIAAYVTMPMNVVGLGDPQRLDSTRVTAATLPMLGVQPVLGRVFTPAEDEDGADGTLVLSYALWQAQFGGDAAVLGRAVDVEGQSYKVIGVMPRDFHFPSQQTQLWTALRLGAEDYQDRNNNYLQGLAKLKRGVSLTQARADLAVVTAQLSRQYPRENHGTGANLYLLRDEVSQQARMLLLALSGAAICVLLIACTNLANLLLARALMREKELAVRSAMGAGRERLVRQLGTESLVLALLGGAMGVAAAIVAAPLLARLVPNTLPLDQAAAMDWRVLGFAGLLTAVTGIGFGVAPAWRICRKTDLSALREGPRTGGGRRERLRSALVMAEVMASVVLLVSAGLLMRALVRLQGIDPGFRSDGVLTLRTALPWEKYGRTARQHVFFSNVLDQVRQLPGVTNAAYISYLPMVMRGGIWPVDVGEHVVERSEAHTASLRFVTPGFFATLRIPIRLGRDVEEADAPDRAWVAVVSESFVERYWPGQDPLGRHFKMAFHDRMVVGEVGDICVRGLEQSSEPQVYLPYRQVDDSSLMGYTPKDLAVRSRAGLGPLVPQIRRIVHAADPEQPISDVRTMAEIVEDDTGARAVQVRVLGAFAFVAFLLAAVGIHGVLAFAVSSRSQEFGVRMALGARRGDIVGMVLRQGAMLAVAGLIPGIVLAYVAGNAMRALLAGVTPRDTVTFAGAVGLCVLMTLLGSLLPAWRAGRVDPVTAMRQE